MHAILENPVQETVKERAPLSREELARRRKTVNAARANCALEGLYVTDQKYIDLNEQYARGEIDLDIIGQYVDSLIRERANEQRKRTA